MPRSRADYSPHIMQFLEQYQQQHGYAPTYREIVNALGLRSTSHVHRAIRHLADNGQIARSPRSSRSIVLTPKPPPEPPVPAPPPAPKVAKGMRFRCTRCHIRIETVTGLCEDCKEGRRLIQYADGMGDDRYFQVSRPRRNPYALAYDREPTKRSGTRGVPLTPTNIEEKLC